MNPVQEGNSTQEDEDWEEWDGRSPFWIHCAAGSFAGVVEHTAVYPLDTVRTHIQVCAACVHRSSAHSLDVAKATAANIKGIANKTAVSSVLKSGGVLSTATSLNASVGHTQLPTGMWQTMRFLVNESAAHAALPRSAGSSVANWNELVGFTRLWRGVQTILVGCIPAHALYFSAYETVKAATTTHDGKVTAWGSSLAGAAAVIGHDVVMTPLDTIKQRMQLGHYQTASSAIREVIRLEGASALYRSFTVTLLSNIPYGMVMVSTHEISKQWLASPDRPNWQTVLVASSMGGFTAAAVTTPLDRIKTALQTQTLAPACLGNPSAPCKQVLLHNNWQQAARYILQTEGWRGFWRGLMPRVLGHTPAVAISWTTYETAKQILLQQYHGRV